MRDDPHLLELRETIRGPPIQPSKQSIEDDKRPNGRSNHRYGATFDEMCRTFGEDGIAARNARHNKARGRWIGAGLAARLNHSSGIEASGLVRQGALSIFGRGAVQQPLKLPEIPVPDLISPRLGKKTNQFCEICVMAAVDEHGRPTERIRKCYYCPVVCHDRCCQAKGYDWVDPKGGARLCCHVCSGHLEEMMRQRERLLIKAQEDYRCALANDILARCARSWLSHRQFRAYKRGVIKVQALCRMALCRCRFWHERVATLRNIQLILYDVTVKGPPLPQNTGLFAVCSVLDDQRNVLFAFDIPESQLRLRDDDRHKKPAKKGHQFGVQSEKEIRAEIAEARLELARAHARLKDPHHRSVAHFDKLENTVPGCSFDFTLVYTLYLKVRKGSHQMEVSQLLGQGSYKLTPADLARCCDRSSRDAITVIPFNHRLHYPLKNQSVQEMKLTARECYRNYVGGEVRVAIRGLNQFANFCGFLEGPHIDILSAPCGGKETGGRTQVYWCTLAHGILGFYYHKGDAHARVSLNATKCRVAHRLHKGYHALSVELPDGRLWFLNPSNPNDAERWLWALEYWRLRSVHGRATALSKVVAPRRRRRRRLASDNSSVASSESCSTMSTVVRAVATVSALSSTRTGK